MRSHWVIIVLIGICLGFGCKKTKPDESVLPRFFEPEIPNGFPSIQYPTDNSFTYTRWLLGKKMFYDKSLSSTYTISCGSCHQTKYGMGDNAQLSLGVDNRLGTRNAPTIANVAYHPYYTRDGGVPTLEMQILVPIQEHNEFDFNIIDIQERLKTNAVYDSLSKAAYNRPLDYYVITRAIANFERTLLSGNSKYDKMLQQQRVFTETEKNGQTLFFSSRTNCSNCHSGFNFSNYAFENNGLYVDYNDIGRKRLTSLDEDLARFKVPTLRNIAVTAPYMHDGSIKRLKDVVDHYNTGGKDHVNKSKLVKPLGLSNSEVADLVSFLETLTDLEFIENKNFRNE
jgi:cytochrome c peroxidase